MADDELVAFWRAQKEAKQEHRRRQLRRVEAVLGDTITALAVLGVTLVAKSEYHFHLTDHAGRVLGQWWPSSGRTMDGQRRGQHCATGKALVSWLRAKLAIPGTLEHQHAWDEAGDGCWDCLCLLALKGVPIFRAPDVSTDVARTIPREALQGLVLEVRIADGKRFGILRPACEGEERPPLSDEQDEAVADV